jgi:ABC-2 type transport system ATP-binding protein
VRLTALLGITTLLAGGAVAVAAAGPEAGAASAFTKATLHFAVATGPDGATPCDIVGDLYTPSDASSSNRVPAILTTNGFGGSKDDQAGIATYLASHGYVVLSYSGLGFGGSGCKITLDDPDYDGRAARQLIDFLGGAPGIAYADAQHTQPAPTLDVVVHDAIDHGGHADTFDPRVGMIGGSYGGGIQFATAAVDPRLDTIIPLITWNDLSYSLGPNNAAQAAGVSSSTPGAVKLNWGLAFSAEGIADGLGGASADPSRLYPCPNFATFVCPALVTAGTTGYFQPGAVAALRHASVAFFMSKIDIPTLLIQGENDTLFNLNEAAATYRALKAQGTPVKMIWQSWGHSDLVPAPGEFDENNPDPGAQYETGRVVDWFAHYLQGSPVGTGPNFAYFRDWAPYQGNASPAYATSGTFPVGTARTYYLSGGGRLADSARAVQPGSQSLVTPPAGAPSSINPLDVLGGYTGTPQQADLPGTFTTWTGQVLARPLDVVGSPTLRVRVDAPSAALSQADGPSGQLVLFVKVEDVAPDGTASTIHGLEAPIRIPDVSAPTTITLPGIVHRFAAGHRVRIVIAGGSDNYRGGLVATPVTIAAGPGQELTLPAVA